MTSNNDGYSPKSLIKTTGLTSGTQASTNMSQMSETEFDRLLLEFRAPPEMAALIRKKISVSNVLEARRFVYVFDILTPHSMSRLT